MIRVGVIGYGYWGPNLVRNFRECQATQVVAVSDLSEDRLAAAGRAHPGLKLTRDYRELLNSPNVDAIAISTPVTTHFPLAMEAIRAGKHVLVEKPMTASSEEALRLIDEAERRRVVLMVDHTTHHAPALGLIDQPSAGAWC